jgi:NAD(P)-dependent dehydrogenase (short-subunit alcohol dehydrogenase family)
MGRENTIFVSGKNKIPMTQDKMKTWFVTGASKGLGFELVRKLLQNGSKVVATSRSVGKLEELRHQYPDSFLPLSMEVSDEKSVQNAVGQALEKFGSIDVVVNNAGYGLLGTLEELSMDEIRKCFEVNVFGVMNVSRAFLPHFRKQKSGMLINIASVSGSVAAASTGIYSATKSAVIQFSESLAAETEEFGIRVVAVCPGGFRTDFLDKTSMATPSRELQEYTLVRKVIERFGELNKNQGGDPEKAAEAFVALAALENPPSRIYLGSDALRMVDRKMNALEESIRQYQPISISTDNY